MTSAESATDRNRRRLRDAAERLLAGRSRVSDGRLTLKSLAVEAGLPRQYLYREAYSDVAKEFEAESRRLAARRAVPDERLADHERLRSEMRELERLNRGLRVEVRALREETRVAASQVAYLVAQNTALREQVASAADVVMLTPSTRAGRRTP